VLVQPTIYTVFTEEVPNSLDYFQMV